MIENKLQKQRFEYKFITYESQVQAIRQYVESYLNLDVFGATQLDRSYPVHSIYLDSKSLLTYTDTINGSRNRYKLRVRYYENGDDKPVYLEVKRRQDRAISKKRAIVHRHVVHELLNGVIPSMNHLHEKTREQYDTLISICQLIETLEAKPKVHIKYFREAYEQLDSNAVRVTFDRNVISEVIHQIEYKLVPDFPVSVFGDKIILELKFTDNFPLWFRDLVQHFELTSGSAAKYVDGLINLHNHHLITLNNR